MENNLSKIQEEKIKLYKLKLEDNNLMKWQRNIYERLKQELASNDTALNYPLNISISQLPHITFVLTSLVNGDQSTGIKQKSFEKLIEFCKENDLTFFTTTNFHSYGSVNVWIKRIHSDTKQSPNPSKLSKSDSEGIQSDNGDTK